MRLLCWACWWRGRRRPADMTMDGHAYCEDCGDARAQRAFERYYGFDR